MAGFRLFIGGDCRFRLLTGEREVAKSQVRLEVLGIDPGSFLVGGFCLFALVGAGVKVGQMEAQRDVLRLQRDSLLVGLFGLC